MFVSTEIVGIKKLSCLLFKKITSEFLKGVQWKRAEPYGSPARVCSDLVRVLLAYSSVGTWSALIQFKKKIVTKKITF